MINSNSYQAIFISEQTLKDNSVINDNVDMELLNPIIAYVQEIQMEKLLGSSLYTHLQDQIVNSGLTTDELFLLQAYIQPCMIWGIMVEAPTYMTYKFATKGIEKMSSDNSQPAGRDELEKIADNARSKFGYYSQRLIRYLIHNTTKYPSYNQAEAGDLLPKTNGYQSVTALNNPFTREQWGRFYRNVNRNNNGYLTWTKIGCPPGFGC